MQNEHLNAGRSFPCGTSGPEVDGDSLFLASAVEVGGETIGHVVVELGLAAEREPREPGDPHRRQTQSEAADP